jgi:acetyl-CoA acetyltransferase
MRTPLTLDDYHASRWICEPFHLLDCTLVNNGAIAVIVTAAERAADLTDQPAYVVGMGQGHPGNPRRAEYENEVNTGAQIAKQTAFDMAGITVDDVDLCELYDCYTYTTLVTLEDYGFCEKGEGGPFVADGKLEPGGSLPTNTGGGELSGYYMWGMTPLSEGVIQARGSGGERQVAKHDVVLVSCQGGILDYHGTLVLSPHRRVS